MTIIVKVLQLSIRVYQWTLSPDHGWLRGRYPYGFCRFYPSCSQYGYEALSLYGPIKGLVLTVLRLFRCNPWAQPGIDRLSNHY